MDALSTPTSDPNKEQTPEKPNAIPPKHTHTSKTLYVQTKNQWNLSEPKYFASPHRITSCFVFDIEHHTKNMLLLFYGTEKTSIYYSVFCNTSHSLYDHQNQTPWMPNRPIQSPSSSWNVACFSECRRSCACSLQSQEQ